jgi:hypothetical protein
MNDVHEGLQGLDFVGTKEAFLEVNKERANERAFFIPAKDRKRKQPIIENTSNHHKGYEVQGQ